MSQPSSPSTAGPKTAEQASEGFISSILNAISSGNHGSTADLHDINEDASEVRTHTLKDGESERENGTQAGHLFLSKLDFLLKPSKFGRSSKHSLHESIDNKSEQYLLGDSESANAEVITTTTDKGVDATPTSNVHFDSIRDSPLQTLGTGNLSLHLFERNAREDESGNNTTGSTMGPSASGVAAVAAGTNKDNGIKRKGSLKTGTNAGSENGVAGAVGSVYISNGSKTGLAPTENVKLDDMLSNEKFKRNASPDLINKQLPNNKQLLVVGQGDSKRVRRRSLVEQGGLSTSDSQNSRALLGETNDTSSQQNIDGGIDDDGISFDEETAESNLADIGISDYQEFRYANKKRNKEFHNNFKDIPRNERLIDDFSCAISKEILVQGRIYLSTHYICFNSNILGWVTNLIIPLQEVIQIEKKTTAGLFPNGMVIRTLHHKYVFATFISRDTIFTLILNVWHRVLLEGNDVDPEKIKRRKNTSTSSRRTEKESEDDSLSDHLYLSDESDYESDDSISDADDMVHEGDKSVDFNGVAGADDESNDFSPKKKGKEGSSEGGLFNGLPIVGPDTHTPTENGYTKSANDTFICDETFNAPVGVIYELLFGDDSSKFISTLKDQKNFDITEENIVGLSNNNKERKYSYIKPLGGPIGPKQTKCNITDTLANFDVDSSILVEQVSHTPDVPSGNSFLVRTKIYLSWAAKNNTRMYVVTAIDWTAKSWLKGAIEKGSIDGQKESMKLLTQSVNRLLKEGTSSGKSNSTAANGDKKKRKRRSTVKQENAPVVVQQEAEQPKSIVQQVTNLVESIGDLIPVNLPFVNNLTKGILVLVLVYYMVISLFGGFLNLVGLRSVGPGLKIDSSGAFISSIKINGMDYSVIPSVDATLSNERLKRNTEAALWEWIRDRSEGKININNSKSEGSHIDLDWYKDYSKVNNKYSNQEIEEMLEMTKMKLNEIQQQMLRSL